MLTNDQSGDLAALSVRQREILGYVVKGLSNAEIGRRLYLSESTIKQHLRAAYKVLGVSNRTEAAKTMQPHSRRLRERRNRAGGLREGPKGASRVGRSVTRHSRRALDPTKKEKGGVSRRT